MILESMASLAGLRLIFFFRLAGIYGLINAFKDFLTFPGATSTTFTLPKIHSTNSSDNNALAYSESSSSHN